MKDVLNFAKNPPTTPTLKGKTTHRNKSGEVSVVLKRHLALKQEVKQLLTIIIPKYAFIPNSGNKKNTDAMRTIESNELNRNIFIWRSNPFNSPAVTLSRYIKGTIGDNISMICPTSRSP